ncbi:MAG: acyltransferase [Akkermansia sp.]|nr:acyltransferase [Akkermansia sp.]
MSNKPFLSHIGGLRGIAILLVILFHLNSSCFPYGFYGVDIFLVISGYLLFLSFSRQNYQLNIREFATKKLLRIFPPMIILVLLTMVAAFYLLEGDNLIETSRTGRYTLFCYANDFLRRTQEDYFAPNALENPFLHMWYLSVTIHLYLMFAIGCIIYRYLPKKTSMLLIWLIGTASFCYGYSYQLRDIFQELNLPVWDQYAAVSHYRTLPRVWELLAGGAILLLPYTASKAKSSLLTLTGLAATLIPAFSSNFLASYGAPAVVLGTMFIVRYMPTSILMPVLSNKILLWVGGFSFSLYLVHMPIIALYLISQHSISGWVDYSIIVMLSLALGWLFWFLVEKRHMNVYAVLTLWGVTMSLCVLGKKLDDIKNSMYPEIQAIQNAPYDDWKFCEPGTLPHALDKKNLLYNDGIFNMADSTIKRPKTDNPLMQMGRHRPHPVSCCSVTAMVNAPTMVSTGCAMI